MGPESKGPPTPPGILHSYETGNLLGPGCDLVEVSAKHHEGPMGLDAIPQGLHGTDGPPGFWLRTATDSVTDGTLHSYPFLST